MVFTIINSFTFKASFVPKEMILKNFSWKSKNKIMQFTSKFEAVEYYLKNKLQNQITIIEYSEKDQTNPYHLLVKRVISADELKKLSILL